MGDRKATNAKARKSRSAANQYRSVQAVKLLELFQSAQGHPAHTAEELETWLASAEGKQILAAPRDSNGKIKPYDN